MNDQTMRDQTMRFEHPHVRQRRQLRTTLQVLTATTTLVLGGVSASAQAQAHPSRRHDEILVSRYVDTHPQTPQAARQTLAQLKDAALEACGGSSFSLAEVKAVVRASPCWHDGVAEAVKRIDDPRLTQTFEQDPR